MRVATKLFDSTIVGTAEQALDFIGNILESSTEYSIIGKALVPCLLAALLFSPAQAQESRKARNVQRDLTQLSLEELANISVVTVSKRAERRLEVPAAVYVITGEMIRRSGVTSIPDALRLAPGVQVARIDSNKWAVGIRGFASRLSRSMLVLLDGRSVYTPLFAGVYWEVQDVLLEDIERIEVIRGPGGTVWGANAVNGVVNIISKKANGTQGALVTAGAGSVEQGFGGFRYGGQAAQKLDYRLYGKFFNRGAGFHHSGRDFDRWFMGQSGFRTDWDSKSGSWTLQGDLYRANTGQRTSITTLSPPAVFPVEEDARLSGGNLLGRWRHGGDTRSQSELKFYYDRANRREPTFQENRDTFDIDFQRRFAVSERHEITGGLGYRLSSGAFDGVPTVAFTPRRRTEHLFSAFGQYGIGALENTVRLTVGSKLEHNDYSGFEAQPSARFLWTPSVGHALWASVSRAVRTPSRVEHDLLATGLVDADPRIFTRFLGNREFVPEKLLAYEVGYRAQPSPRFFLDIAAFYDDYDDLLSIEPGRPFREEMPPPGALILPFLLGNGIGGVTRGGEVAFEWRPLEKWRWIGGYSHLQIRMKSDATSRDVSTAASTQGSSPRHQIFLESFLDLPAKLELDLVFRYTDELPSSRIDSYATADVRLGWRPSPRFELSVAGQNLFQGHHPEFSGATAGTTEVKRGAYAKVTWRW